MAASAVTLRRLGSGTGQKIALPAYWTDLQASARDLVLGDGGGVLATAEEVKIFTAEEVKIFTASGDEISDIAMVGNDDVLYVGMPGETWRAPSPSSPVLVYFRERQTTPEGQGHLFPMLFQPAQLRRLMAERVGEERRVESWPRI